MLESLDQTNIGSLTLEDRKEYEFPFDPSQELSVEEKQRILEMIRKTRTNSFGSPVGQWSDFRYWASGAALVFPEETEKLGLDEQIFNLNEAIIQERKLKTPFGLARNLRAIKTLFPQRFRELNIGQEEWEILKKRTDEVRNSNDWKDNFEILASMSIIFPERIDELVFNEDELNNMRNEVNKELDHPSLCYLYAQRAANFKLFCPAKAINLVPEQRGKHLREHFQEWRRRYQEGNWILFPEYVANLKILSAEQIKITNNGFEFVMPNNFAKPPAPPIPEMRKF
ncbi:MAG: hypothetical protein Q7R49_01745 [Candidatus Daviesbacteria bacterium]|nr:hypothetical protein [Candidatus Daviesbacteria bacterium]